jgi:hypothetical protein
MPHGKPRKKKKHLAQLAANPEQEDELVALAAIFGLDFQLKEGSRNEFKIRVLPFPGEPETRPIAFQGPIETLLNPC